jgi:hypothetical protein
MSQTQMAVAPGTVALPQRTRDPDLLTLLESRKPLSGLTLPTFAQLVAQQATEHCAEQFCHKVRQHVADPSPTRNTSVGRQGRIVVVD